MAMTDNKLTSIYLAGPMRGIRHFNFPAFDEARDRLGKQGFRVISPADLDRDAGFDAMALPDDWDWNDLTMPNFSLEEAIRRDTDAVLSADAIAMLPGWERSIGAKAEMHLAKWRGMAVCLYRDGVLARFGSEAAVSLPQGRVHVLPSDAQERKKYPVFTGLMSYFPNALALVARQSWEGGQQHHPDEPLHWDMSKSSDELDACGRHWLEGEPVACAWRMLAHLERLCLAGYDPFRKRADNPPGGPS